MACRFNNSFFLKEMAQAELDGLFALEGTFAEK